MGNRYVYCLIDENEGDIGIFTSVDKAVQAAIDDGWCESYYGDDISTPDQVFANELMHVEKIPLNKVYY